MSVRIGSTRFQSRSSTHMREMPVRRFAVGVRARRVTRVVMTTLTLSLSVPAMAGPLRVLFERDVDSPGGTELAINTYPSFADFFAGTNFTSQFSTINVNAPYSVGGITWDGTAYQVLFERDIDGPGGTELAINTYPTLADFFAGTNFTSQFSAINVNSPYSVGGITWDGIAYRVLFERDVDTAGGTELAINSYATLADFFAGNSLSSQFSSINVNAPYSVGGFAYDANGYHVLFERDEDSAGGIELAINSYATLADFFAGTNFTSQFSSINVNAPYSVGGFLIEPDGDGDPGPGNDPGGGNDPDTVPEPSPLALLATAMAALFVPRWTYRQCPCRPEERPSGRSKPSVRKLSAASGGGSCPMATSGSRR